LSKTDRLWTRRVPAVAAVRLAAALPILAGDLPTGIIPSTAPKPSSGPPEASERKSQSQRPKSPLRPARRILAASWPASREGLCWPESRPLGNCATATPLHRVSRVMRRGPPARGVTVEGDRLNGAFIRSIHPGARFLGRPARGVTVSRACRPGVTSGLSAEGVVSWASRSAPLNAPFTRFERHGEPRFQAAGKGQARRIRVGSHPYGNPNPTQVPERQEVAARELGPLGSLGCFTPPPIGERVNYENQGRIHGIGTRKTLWYVCQFAVVRVSIAAGIGGIEALNWAQLMLVAGSELAPRRAILMGGIGQKLVELAA